MVGLWDQPKVHKTHREGPNLCMVVYPFLERFVSANSKTVSKKFSTTTLGGNLSVHSHIIKDSRACSYMFGAHADRFDDTHLH
jgi:hypothetical protein